MPSAARPIFVLPATALAVFSQDSKPPFEISGKWPVPEDATFPGAEWEKVASAKAAGFSTAKLEVLRAWLKTQNTTGMLVVKGGRVLFEYGDIRAVSK